MRSNKLPSELAAQSAKAGRSMHERVAPVGEPEPVAALEDEAKARHAALGARHVAGVVALRRDLHGNAGVAGKTARSRVLPSGRSSEGERGALNSQVAGSNPVASTTSDSSGYTIGPSSCSTEGQAGVDCAVASGLSEFTSSPFRVNVSGASG